MEITYCLALRRWELIRDSRSHFHFKGADLLQVFCNPPGLVENVRLTAFTTY